MTQQALSHLKGIELFRSHFHEVEDRANSNGQAWFLNSRKAAFAKFNELGFPTQRQEDWKHTSVRPIVETEFRRPEEGAFGVDVVLEGVVFHDYIAHRAVFVDGRFSPDHSKLDDLPEGLTILSLNEVHSNREVLEAHLARYAGEDENPAFAALNTALHEDGLFIHIAKNIEVAAPIHLIYLTAGHGEPTATHPRTLMIAEPGSRAVLIERYAGPAGAVYFTNAVTEVVVGENASLVHHRLQDESPEAYHIGTVQIELKRDSRYTGNILSIGSKIGRNGVAARLNGEGIECVLNGLFLTRDDQHIDNHTRVVHAEPHCHSHEVFKGILDGRSSGAFTGRIIVKPGAQKTDAIQSSKNLLLSDEASITPDPQLEIFADDVKCTHGATIGQLDADAIFYLRARGIDEQSAKGLLTYAFANEIVEQIEIEPLRDYLEAIIAQRYRKGAQLGEPS